MERTQVPYTCMAEISQEVRAYESVIQDDTIVFSELKYNVTVGMEVGVRQECNGYVEIYSVYSDPQEIIPYDNTWVLKSAVQFEDTSCKVIKLSQCTPPTP